MLRWKMSACPIAVLLLGCQSVSADTANASALVFQPLNKQYESTDCQVDDCSQMKITALTFPDDTALTEDVQTRLMTLAMESSDETDSWDSFADAFLARAKEDGDKLPQFMSSQADLEASAYAQQNGLLVLELDSYVIYGGNANGVSSTEFMVVDEGSKQVVTLDDMLVAGGQEAFDEVLAEAHKQWLSKQDVGEDFASTWPFTPSANVAPLKDEWIVKYNSNEISPHYMGQPVLAIPVAELTGIVQPRYLGQ